MYLFYKLYLSIYLFIYYAFTLLEPIYALHCVVNNISKQIFVRSLRQS
jgi:hypothetical protein